MLRFFRVNDPYRLIFISLILVGARIVIWNIGVSIPTSGMKWLLLGERLGDWFTMYSETYDFTAPFSALVYRGMDILFGRSILAHYILSTLLILFQAGILNHILLKNRAYNDSTYLPAFFYAIISLAIPDFFLLSPQLLSITFILLAMNNIFRRIDNVVTDQLFLNAGIYLGIAVLFYLPTIVYFILFFISLIVFANAVPRRLLLYIYGLFIPFVLSYCYYFWKGAHFDFIDYYLFRGLLSPRFFEVSIMDLLILISPLGFWLLWSILGTFGARGFANFQIKIQQVMLFSLAASVLTILIDVHFSSIHLVLFLPALSFFMTHYQLAIKKKWAVDSMPILVVLTILIIPVYIYPRLNEPQNFSSNKNLDRGLMYLGNDLSIYANYTIKSPFLDSLIMKEKVKDMDFYEPAEKMFSVFENSSPDIIIDEIKLMDKIAYRFPDFANKYTEYNGVYVRVD